LPVIAERERGFLVRTPATRTIIGPLAVIALVMAMALPALGGGRPLSAELSGENERPVPTNHPATGTAVVTLNQGLGEVCADIETTGFEEGEVLAGHIHVGDDDVAGPVVVDLEVTSPDHSICVTGVDPELIKDIRQNPSGYYVNLHTAEFPGGAIRGQLGK
jgi:hypothetical protein